MLDTLRWDADLIQRHDRPGPRYTSYPSAAQFHPGIGPAELLRALDDSRQARRPLSLYLHPHLPFCANVCHYCACHKLITRDRRRAQPYLRSLHEEIRQVGKRLDPAQVVEQLHLGGGTPTFLGHAELRQLLDHLRRHFNLLDDDSGDYSIEIDPREADGSSMELLRELGFNRVSLGVQDLDPAAQRAVDRLQTLERTRALVDAARTLQFRSVNIDLIYGLPRQRPERFARALGQVIELRPDRLALFNYAHLPSRFPAQRRIQPHELPAPAEKLAILRNSIGQLTAAGYRYIGMDHFALADDELAIAQEDQTLQRNFQGYTTHGHCDLIGLGVSAISEIDGLYAQNGSDLAEYQRALAEGRLATLRGLHSSQDDRLRRAVIQQLMCRFELDIADIEQTWSIDFRQTFAPLWPRLEAMATDGLIRIAPRFIEVTPTGRLLVRALCGVFDAYLAKPASTLFSRVI